MELLSANIRHRWNRVATCATSRAFISYPFPGTGTNTTRRVGRTVTSNTVTTLKSIWQHVEKRTGSRYTLFMPRKSSAANTQKRSSYNVRQAVGSNIKIRRLKLGWSQQELADRFGVSRAAISQYEIGTGEVNAGDLPRLAEILGLSLLEFYEGPMFDLFDTSAENENWPVKMATLFLERTGLLDKAYQDSGLEVGLFKEKLKASADADEITRDYIFILDEWLGASYGIPNAGKHERNRASVARLADLAGHFLSLSLQDQETLSRVAEALHDKPAVKDKPVVKDEPAVASKKLPTNVPE